MGTQHTNGWLSVKEEGNKLFKAGDYVGALEKYAQALTLCEDESWKAVLLSNGAAAHLKLERFDRALQDSTAALEIAPADVKSLFRRCQANEGLGKVDEAFKDARKALHLDPKNKQVQAALQRLTAKLQDIAREQNSTTTNVEKMLFVVADPASSPESTRQALSNLVVIARENAGAEILARSDAVAKCWGRACRLKDPESYLSCVRLFGELARRSHRRALAVTRTMGLPATMDLLTDKNERHVTAVQYLIQTILDALSGADSKEGGRPDEELTKKHEKEIDAVMTTLVKSVSSRVMSAAGRDAVLELLARNVDHDRLCWGAKLVDCDGLSRILEVASELEGIRYESSMDISPNTRPNCSVCLDRIYYCMDHDKAKEKYREKVDNFVTAMLSDPEIESKVRVTSAITALLSGPLDVGNHCLARQGVVEMMLSMANSDDPLQQRVAAEALVAAASKKDKCTSIISMGMGILRKLYESSDDDVRVRALVGLCKLGSFGGTDSSLRPFSEATSRKLATACRKFLVDPEKDKDVRKWAAEGLAFLTLDAEVKEELVGDREAIRSLVDLAKTEQKAVLYGVVTTLVNLTNSYEKQEVIPELVELAKFAKQHVPEEHPLDGREHVARRISVLAECGITVALVALSCTESNNSREMISRVFNAICEHHQLRGHVVQQGGVKALLKLALENTEKGKHVSAQALARLGITINPEVAFPGQRAVEVVRPLVSLLHPDCSALQNFEALMALTNLALVGESVRERIVKDGGITSVEHYIYEDHVMLKRAGMQCILNLMQSDTVVKIFEKGDRIKYLTLCLEDEDYETSQAAAGALAWLTSRSEDACRKLVEVKEWDLVLGGLAAHKDGALQHRGVCILSNLVHSGKEVAEKLVDTKLVEVLMAVTQVEGVAVDEKIKALALQALNKAEEWKLIQKRADTQ